MTVTEQPPQFEPTNSIEVSSVEASKIIGVSLYSRRAEVTRLFELDLPTGQNLVKIKGLPSIIDEQSLRVEGRGDATIHDVTVQATPVPPKQDTSDKLKSLQESREKVTKALERCKKSIQALESFLGSMNVQHVDHGNLDNVLGAYSKNGEKLDDEQSKLQKELDSLNAEIQEEQAYLSGPSTNERLGLQASIGVFAEVAGKVEIAVIYAVSQATWNAAYDIRVDMQAAEAPVILIYKAIVTQNTGEDWTDVPLTLECASPTFGLGLPSLNPWKLAVHNPQPPSSDDSAFIGFTYKRTSAPQASVASASRRARSTAMPAMAHQGAEVSSKGNFSATFRIPGDITIPSDGASHNFTIVQLKLEATMTWVSVPKQDVRTHLKARVTNASEYVFLRGTASVYLDGSFISRSAVPDVSPLESFDCPLGLDPSVRITYHPVQKKLSQTGFYNKSNIHIYTQRLTIHNTKNIPLLNLKLVDQVPISEDSQIEVKLISPALTLVGTGAQSASDPRSSGFKQPTSTVPSQITVQPGVLAQWDGADEPDLDLDSLGKEGKFNWLVSVPAQGKVSLALQWEVTIPSKVQVVGM